LTVNSVIRHGIAAALVVAFAAPGFAQLAVENDAAKLAAPPSPEAVSLARTLVDKSSDGDVAALNFLGPPMVGLLTELGFVRPEQFKTVVDEVIIPVLKQHQPELNEIQAQSYAALLSVDDMKGAIAFYDSAAGRDLVRIHAPRLAMNLAGVSQLLETLKPQIEARANETLKAHGWSKGGAAE